MLGAIIGEIKNFIERKFGYDLTTALDEIRRAIPLMYLSGIRSPGYPRIFISRQL